MRSRQFLLPLAFVGALLCAAAPVGAQLPPSKDAPKAGEKMPDFMLPDTQNKPVNFSDLLKPVTGDKGAAEGSWVILIFYRGYW